MKDIESLRSSADVFLGCVPLTDSRTVVVFLEERGGWHYLKLNTYARNRKRGHWYLTRAYYTLRLERAADLGRALILGSEGRPFGDPPAWWAGYQAEYQEWKASQPAEADQAAPATGPNNSNA